MKNQKEKYLKDLQKHLRVEKKIKSEIIEDIRSDINLRMSNGEKINEILTNLGSAKNLAYDFNKSYPEYKSDRLIYLTKKFSICTSVIAIICFAIGMIGRIQFLSSNKIATIGGVDGPANIIISSQPISPLKIYNFLLIISSIFILLLIFCVIFLLTRSKKGD